MTRASSPFEICAHWQKTIGYYKNPSDFFLRAPFRPRRVGSSVHRRGLEPLTRGRVPRRVVRAVAGGLRQLRRKAGVAGRGAERRRATLVQRRARRTTAFALALWPGGVGGAGLASHRGLAARSA